MNDAQLWLMKVGLPDKCVGNMTKTTDGETIVDGALLYVSDLMMGWGWRALKEMELTGQYGEDQAAEELKEQL